MAAVMPGICSAVVFLSLKSRVSAWMGRTGPAKQQRDRCASPALSRVTLVREALLGFLPSTQQETKVTTASGGNNPVIYSGW